MDADQPNFFAGPYLERCSEVREDVTLLATLRADPHAQYLVARGTAHLLHIEPEPRIDFHAIGHPLVAGIEESRHVYLGRFRGRPTVMVELPAEGSLEIEETRFQELRPRGGECPGAVAHRQHPGGRGRYGDPCGARASPACAFCRP